MRGPATLLWLIYATTGLPLTVFGYLFTGGGLPRPTLLDDWSNPILVLIWAFASFLIFILPAAALAATGWSLVERLRDREEEDRT